MCVDSVELVGGIVIGLPLEAPHIHLNASNFACLTGCCGLSGVQIQLLYVRGRGAVHTKS